MVFTENSFDEMRRQKSDWSDLSSDGGIVSHHEH